MPRSRTHLLIRRWTAARSAFRTSGPSAAEPVAMPPDNGVRLHDHQRRAPVLPDSRQGDPKQSIAKFEAQAVRVSSPSAAAEAPGSPRSIPMAAERQRECAGDDEERKLRSGTLTLLQCYAHSRRIIGLFYRGQHQRHVWYRNGAEAPIKGGTRCFDRHALAVR